MADSDEGWIMGPRLGWLGTLLGKPQAGLLSEHWVAHPEIQPELVDALSRLKQAPPPWICPTGAGPGQEATSRFQLERVRGVSLGALITRLRKLKRELPLAAASFITFQVARAFAGPSPAPNLRVHPNGVRLHWDGTVRLLPAPLHRLRRKEAYESDLREAGYTDVGDALDNLRALLSLTMERRVPPDVLAARSPAAVADLLERQASPAWLKSELPELFPIARVTERSLDDHALHRHPDQLPKGLIERVESDGLTEANLAVLTDHLLSLDRPRAKLAMLQTGRAYNALDEMELCRRWVELSPVEIPTDERLEWKAGWVTGLTLRRPHAEWSIASMIFHPATVFLQRLTVVCDASTCRAAIGLLARGSHHALRRLELAFAADEARLQLTPKAPRLEIAEVPADPAPPLLGEQPEPPGILDRLRNVLLGRR